ncbi:integrator complex subunit 13-like [Centruroides sculpturatus]|uniref:integrator complex subunit 13-like n=1 Tax=Centruroides sculpturatus TaxID=218467 RepID=UPI000C6E4755|nr:integrator complex subunit 13-like [Centruroides sculpturatus]
MSYPTSHKTIFVLDHSPQFHSSCKQTVEFDIFTKTRQPGIIPLAPIAKSLWTCAVEAAIEYCRIVWDIYPTGKLIQFIISDNTTRTLNTWSQSEQNLNLLMSSLAHVGTPDTQMKKDCNIHHGLRAAIESLCQCSEVQHEKRTSLTENAGKVMNRGRIVCITYLRSSYFTDHSPQFHSSCKQTVEFDIFTKTRQPGIIPLAPIAKSLWTCAVEAAIEYCRIVWDIYPTGKLIQFIISDNTTRTLNTWSQSEQNLNLVHSLVNTEGIHVSTVKEGQVYETVTLKWCTPRSSAVELQYCTGSYRITPVDVNSRPSSCLTNFLLNGRAVMLEMPRKTGTKVLSHMLASHGGEIFIHTLGTSRSILEDPPSISEGCGGRVTDYRINVRLRRAVMLEMPRKTGTKVLSHMLASHGGEIFIHTLGTSRSILEDPPSISEGCGGRVTDYRINQLNPLLTLVTKSTLTEDEVIECKKIIYQLVGMESKGTSLPVPTIGTRGKGPKREEQYRVMWNELETFVRLYCSTAEHRSILDCLIECRKPGSESENNSRDKLSGGNSSTNTNPLPIKKTEKLFIKEEKSDSCLLTETEFGCGESFSSAVDRDDDDRFKFPPWKKSKSSVDMFRNKLSGPQSLLSLWTNRINSEHSKHHVEFAGRINSNNGIAKLYTNLNTESNSD